MTPPEQDLQRQITELKEVILSILWRSPATTIRRFNWMEKNRYIIAELEARDEKPHNYEDEIERLETLNSQLDKELEDSSP